MLMRPYFARGRMTIPRRSMLAPRYRGSMRIPRMSSLRRPVRALTRPRLAPARFARRVARVVGSLPTIRRYR